MKKFLKLKFVSQILITSFIAALAVTSLVGASTTISSNITTGGTLTVSGATSLEGNVTLGNASTDVNLLTGTLQASTTALFTGEAIFYATTTIAAGKGLVLGLSATDLTGATEGEIYYESGSKVIKMYDGSAWHVVGTSTSGWTLSTMRLQPSDLDYYQTIGTTTQQGFSVMTLEATTTDAIPLTLVSHSDSTANIFQAVNVLSTHLFSLNASGGAFASSTLDVTGVATFYGNTVLGDAAADAITLNGTIGSGVFASSTLDVTGVATFYDDVSVNGGAFTFNEDSADKDFRVEGDGNANMLFVDAGNDYLGVATGTPAYPLEVDGDMRVGESGAADAFFVDATNKKIGIASSTPTAHLSVYDATTGTSTIDFGMPCFRMSTPDGTDLYYYPCISGCADGQAWATTTESCF
ncbi:MAG: hypothetical protein ABIG60_00005 [Patescibacteria group bacterium]